MVHFTPTFLAMNTPAISEAVRGAPALPAAMPGGVPARRQRSAPTPFRTAAPAWRGPAANVPARSAAWEILAGALLVIAWALLWSFFLTAVVEPGAALQRRADAAAERWVTPSSTP